MLFIQGIPMAFMIYIIAFGDFITGENLVLSESENRKDEYIDFNSNRSNVISGIRNIFMAIFSSYIPMCGPLVRHLQEVLLKGTRLERKPCSLFLVVWVH